MKCLYIYTDQGEKILIPGCMAVTLKLLGCYSNFTFQDKGMYFKNNRNLERGTT